MVIDTWNTRDLPALEYLVGRLDADPESWVAMSELSDHLGSRTAAVGALHALTDDHEPYVTGHDTSTFGAYDFLVQAVTPRARRAVGAWPSAEGATQLLQTALEDLAGTGPTQQDRAMARRALEGFVGLSRASAVRVMGRVVNGHTP